MSKGTETDFYGAGAAPPGGGWGPLRTVGLAAEMLGMTGWEQGHRRGQRQLETG